MRAAVVGGSAVCLVAVSVLGGLLVPSGATAAPAAAPTVAPGAIATPVHRAYVVFVDDTHGNDSYQSTRAQMLASIDEVLSRWTVESDGLISSFTRAGAVQTFSYDCTQGPAYAASWSAADQLFPGVSFTGSSGNHLIVYGPGGCGGDGGASGASDAESLSSGGKVYVPDIPGDGTGLLLHELGHNFGLEHSHAVYCDPSSTCSVLEYGNEYDFMGNSEANSTTPYTPASLDSFERLRLKIPQACEVPSISLAAGQQSVTATYDLFGRGSSTGTRGLVLTDPQSGVRTILDWRDHAGRDAGAFYSTQHIYREDANIGLTVEQVAPDGDSSILQTYLADGRSASDTSPGTYLYAYTAGQTYTADGTTVHVDAMPAGNGTDATTQVTVTLTAGSNPDTGAPAALPVQTGSVQVTGSNHPGRTLVATPTSWTPGACYRYQWFEDGSPVAGARSSTFTAPDDFGHQVTVAVTGQQTGYQPLVVRSPAVTILPPRSFAERAGKPADTGHGFVPDGRPLLSSRPERGVAGLPYRV